MLPKLLVGSYKQYKDDTSMFVTWLGSAAEACGCESNAKKGSMPNPSVRPKQDPKILASSKRSKNDDTLTISYKITTKELIDHINTISQSVPNVVMPACIKIRLKRAIKAREKCSDWYTKTFDEATYHDDNTHRFFITILQDALAKLGGQEDDEGKESCPEESEGIRFENRFSHLDIEDLDDDSNSLTPTGIALAATSTQKSSPMPVDIVELEEKREHENKFAVFCFFNDIHRILEQLREIWKECDSGKTNLVTATAVTHIAICMIRKAEQDLCSNILPDEPDDDSYTALATKIVPKEEITGGMDPEKYSKNNTTFGNFILLPTGRVLMKFIKEAGVSDGRYLQWPPPITPLLFGFQHTPQPEELAECDVLYKNDRILTQMLLDLHLPDWLNKYEYGMHGHDILPRPPQEDIFSTMLRPVWTEGKISATAVITSQILVDILNTCKIFPSFPNQMLRVTEYASEPIFYKVSADVEDTGGDLKWDASGTEFLDRINYLFGRVKNPMSSFIKIIMLQTEQMPEVRCSLSNVSGLIRVMRRLDIQL
ncbi:hypothetical protein M426DRAFT_144524 [Hypoxylon sp. CI-4A]|nr:hypothetical protein M426DRAFT_144524 [Hypoxylon sp. CI-4A]